MSKKENKLEKFDEDYNELTKDIVKKELLAKLERKFQENDPAIFNALKALINEGNQPDEESEKWNVK